MILSETLVGVLIGGVIASIAPIAHLVTDHRRWKHEAKLAHLKAERRKKEELYADTLSKLGEAMAKKVYPSDMMSDIYVLMPKEIGEQLDAYIRDEDKEKDKLKGKHVYMDICVIMKRSLADIDKQIYDLIN